jgi:hypothetical protein
MRADERTEDKIESPGTMIVSVSMKPTLGINAKEEATRRRQSLSGFIRECIERELDRIADNNRTAGSGAPSTTG